METAAVLETSRLGSGARTRASAGASPTNDAFVLWREAHARTIIARTDAERDSNAQANPSY